MMLLRAYMSEAQPWLLSSKHKTELSSRDGLVYTHACSPCLRKADCVEVPSSNSQDQGHQTSAQQRHDLLSLKSEPGVFVANPRRPNKALFFKVMHNKFSTSSRSTFRNGLCRANAKFRLSLDTKVDPAWGVFDENPWAISEIDFCPPVWPL